MGALSSLSKSTTLTFWDWSLFFTFLFGAVFLAAWLTEEFAESDKWKSRKKLLVTIAVIAVFGEQVSTLLEFAFAEHIQTIDEREVASIDRDTSRLKKDAETARAQIADANERVANAQKEAAEARRQTALLQEEAASEKLQLDIERERTSWRTINEAKFVRALNQAPSGLTVAIWYKKDDSEAYMFAVKIRDGLRASPKWTVEPIRTIPSDGREEEPADIRFGSFQELTLKCSADPALNPAATHWKGKFCRPSDSNAFAVLQSALMNALESGSRDSSESIDPSIPAGHCVVVIGQEGAS